MIGISTTLVASYKLQPALLAQRELVRVNASTHTRDKSIRMPVIYYGADVADVTNHIDDAQNLEALPPDLSKNEGPEPSRDWYRNLEPCKGNTHLGSGMECDEYPFASTDQGGKFAGIGLFGYRVSVRPVDELQNSAAGFLLKKFYAVCGISTLNPTNRGWFGVVTLPTIGTSDFDCGLGE